MASTEAETAQRDLQRQKMVTSQAPMLLAYDSVSSILLAILLELREIKEELYTQGASSPDA